MAKILWVGADFYMTKKVTVDYESGMTKCYRFSAIPKTVEEWLKEHSPKTWEEIEIERNPFGFVACMKSVTFDIETLNRDPFEMLAEFEQRAKEDIFFNKTMVEAVKQYIEEKGLTREEEKGAKEMTREEKSNTIKAVEENTKAVIGAYQETDKPSETVERLVETMGYDNAVVAVATIVNRVSVHDGRIYDGVREWAKSICDAPNHEVMESFNIYGVDSWIHSAHVNQIGEAMKNYEPKTEPQTVDACDLIHEIKNELGDDAPTDIGYICDYSETSYISDIFAEWADGETSIYYHDIIKYISEHVEAVNDAIKEFGWDGCDSDLYKAGQMAEYLEVNNWLWEHETEAYKVYALNWFRFEYGVNIRKEEWGRFCCEIEQYGQCERIGDAVEIMRQCLDDDREREVA